MSEDKSKEGKRYTQAEVDKLVTDAKSSVSKKLPKLDIHIGLNNYQDAPEVLIKINGGDVQLVHEFARNLSKMILKKLPTLASTTE